MKSGLHKAAQALGGLLFIALFLVFVVQITARFAFNKPLAWSDEAAVILYVWIILWAAATMVPQREHVAFDLVWNLANARWRRILQVLGNALVGSLALVALPASWDYVRFMAREGTPVLGVPLMAVYLPFIVLLLAMVLRSLGQIVQALRGPMGSPMDNTVSAPLAGEISNKDMSEVAKP
jgi:TRAP-type C4-dicarboxylate transport system permease small subunit